MKNKRSLVIGGAGFIGSHLTNYLVNEGCEVVIIDNFATSILNDYNSRASKIHKIDVRSKESYEIIKQNFHYIFFLPAICSTDDFLKKPLESFSVSVDGIKNVLLAMENYPKNSKPFLYYFSTSEVYGLESFETSKLVVNIDKRCGYDVGKLAGETMLYSYKKQNKCLDYKVIRPFNIYGSREMRAGVIPKFILQAMAGNKITIYNNGQQARTFTHIDDFIRALDLIIKKGKYRDYNISSNETITINELASKIIKIVGVKPQDSVEYIKKDLDEIFCRVGNNSRLKNELGFEPKIKIEQGILETYKWLKENNIGSVIYGVE